jgi:hypothetical protein
MSGERYLGNSELKIVHDLEKENQQCRINDIIFSGKEIPFLILDEAHRKGFMDCNYCLQKVESQFLKNYMSSNK